MTVRPNFATAWAPAKVNLYLHVGRPGPGGLHPVDSLVMFADARAADRVSVRPAPQLSLKVEGPVAKALKNAPNNLTMAAAVALREACARTGLGAALTLHKELPVAGGVGGGSSDAAATLLLLNEMWGVGFGEPALEKLAEQLGSDVPACVRRRPLVMRGVGERLSEAVAPDLPAVLVNPGVPLETRKVFQRFDMTSMESNFHEVAPPAVRDARGFAEALAAYRNDLQGPAVSLCPDIEKVLLALRGQSGCLFARMSGSGPTCFALFESEAQAEAAADALARRKRRWWVRATVLRGGAGFG